MLIEEVERIWAPIAAGDDWSVFHAKLADIAAMGRAYGAIASDGTSRAGAEPASAG